MGSDLAKTKLELASWIADSASPVQQGLTIIEIRPYRNGWQLSEAPGVQL